jgi:hypothetical protein
MNFSWMKLKSIKWNKMKKEKHTKLSYKIFIYFEFKLNKTDKTTQYSKLFKIEDPTFFIVFIFCCERKNELSLS